MKNKMKAMTLLEVIMVLGIVGVLIVLFLGVIKPKIINNDKPKIKATLYNAQKVFEILLANERANGNWTLNSDMSTVCTKFADMVNTKGNIDCSENSLNKPNFVMANGVAISGLGSGTWRDPASESSDKIKHWYRDIAFNINQKKNVNNKGVENENLFKIRIFKDEPILIPLSTSLLNSKDIARFKVITIKEEQNGTYIQTYKVVEGTQNGVSYGEAACITGIADEFLTQSEKASITNCIRQTDKCSRYFDCKIQIMDIPNAIVSFKGAS